MPLLSIALKHCVVLQHCLLAFSSGLHVYRKTNGDMHRIKILDNQPFHSQEILFSNSIEMPSDSWCTYCLQFLEVWFLVSCEKFNLKPSFFTTYNFSKQWEYIRGIIRRDYIIITYSYLWFQLSNVNDTA